MKKCGPGTGRRPAGAVPAGMLTPGARPQREVNSYGWTCHIRTTRSLGATRRATIRPQVRAQKFELELKLGRSARGGPAAAPKPRRCNLQRRGSSRELRHF